MWRGFTAPPTAALEDTRDCQVSGPVKKMSIDISTALSLSIINIYPSNDNYIVFSFQRWRGVNSQKSFKAVCVPSPAGVNIGSRPQL